MQINEEWKLENDKYQCPYCKKEYSKKGISTHIWRSHSEGKIHNPNKGYEKGRTAWNKGLTKETDKRVKKGSEILSYRIKEGLITPSFKGKKHSEETKKKISEKLNVNNKGGRCKWYLYKKKNNDIVSLQGTWELRFAKVLDTIDKNWIKPKLYNKHSFKWVDDEGNEHTYTPDFYSPKLNKYFEVKGYWWGDDRRKMQLVIEQNKKISIEIVMKKELVLYEKLLISKDNLIE